MMQTRDDTFSAIASFCSTNTIDTPRDDVVVELVRDGNEACLSLRLIAPSPERAVFLHELLPQVFWRVAAWLAGGALPAVRFDFAFDAPAHADSYGKVFPAPLHFACEAPRSGSTPLD